MKKFNRVTIVTVLCLAAFVIMGIIATTKSQTQNSNQISQGSQTPTPNAEQLKNLQQLQKLQQDVPIANYNELLPSNLAEKTNREKKNKARNLKSQYGEDPKRFALTEERNSAYGYTRTMLQSNQQFPPNKAM